MRKNLPPAENKYRLIYENSLAAILELDFSPVAQLARHLHTAKITDIRQFISEHPVLVKKALGNIKVLTANRAAFDLYGVRGMASLQGCLKKTFTSAAMELFVEQFIALLHGEKSFSGEFKHYSGKKGQQDFFLSISVPREYEASFAKVIVTMQDITSWKKIVRQLRRSAQVDHLTKLLNQGTIVQRLEEELVRAKRYGLTVSCMMVDLDFFKVINDKFGHQRGDQILRRVSAMIRNCFRKVDIVGRCGGDEFLVILPETKPQNAKYAAMRLQKIFSEAVFKYKRIISFHITLSIGITGYPQHKVKDAKELVAIADKAMYSCKMAGRNRIAIL